MKMKQLKDFLKEEIASGHVDIYVITGLVCLIVQAAFFIAAVGYLFKDQPIHSFASISLGAYFTYVIRWWEVK